MNSRPSGFSLVETVMVIVILGILVAFAIPKFVNFGVDVQQTSVDDVAASLGSASAINYAVRSLDPTKGTKVTSCTDISGALDGGLHKDYRITGVPARCTVTHTASSLSAAFIGHAI